MMLTESPMYYAGGGFPWGLLIVGGILYFLWRNGVFDRFGGPGGPGRQGNGQRYGGGYGSGYGPAQMPEAPGPEQGGDPGFRGPRAVFDEWHRQSHETAVTPPQGPAAPPAAPATEAPSPGSGEPAR